MYNESQKEEFIRYAQNDYWKYVFEAAADYEAEKRKDLTRMDTEELLWLLTFNNQFSRRQDYQKQNHKIYRLVCDQRVRAV